MPSIHKSVLLQEVIRELEVKEGDTFFDGTLGGAGHALAICEVLGKSGVFIGVDRDKHAVDEAKKMLHDVEPAVHLLTENYRNIATVLENLGIHSVDKVLLDLGISSDQLENSKRGFSFQKDEPLLMTMRSDPDENTLTARDVVNHFTEEALLDVIRGYSDERYARRIVTGIATARKKSEIATSKELADIISSSVPAFYRHGKIHPATKTFQAIRIAVNDEYGGLVDSLEACWQSLTPGTGKMAVIAFHSLEDRAVKRFLREKEKSGEAALSFKKPLVPTEDEKQENPRSRSAKLRVATRKK